MGSGSILGRVEVRLEPALYIDGRRVLDERGVRLLSILDSVDSLLEASRRLGIPYSRVWEYISKVERALKTEVVRVRRGGGGGLRLTDEGYTVVRYVRDRVGAPASTVSRDVSIGLHIAGSDDPLLELFIGSLRRVARLNIVYSKVGSLRGLSSLLLGDSHIAPIHLIDLDTGEYNIPYVRKLGLGGYVALLRGYFREVGYIYRSDISISGIEDVIRGGYRVVNRCIGSGIKTLFDKLIRDYASSHGLDFNKVIESISGYGDMVDTHLEAVKSVVDGDADVTLGLRVEAEAYGLGFTPVLWEEFDLVVDKSILDTDIWENFHRYFVEEVPRLMDNFVGYKLSNGFGELVWI